MSWIALAGDGPGWLCPEVFGSGPRGDALLARGSLLVETRLSTEARPQTLLAFRRDHPWITELSLQSVPGGGIVLVMRQGADVFHTVLNHARDARADVLRITFSWDAPRRWGRLTVERPEADAVDLLITPAPLPLMIEDLRAMVQSPALCLTDPDLVFWAVSDAIEPVGPMPSLTGGLPVATPDGARDLRDLRCGDTVLDGAGAMVPVLHRVERVVPARGSFRPVRLRAPYFGLRRDVVVAPHQRLVIGGSNVEYLFGREAVLVPVLSLINGFAAVFEDGPGFLRYRQLVLPGHEALMVAGAAMESLYVGRLGRDRARLAATLLADCPRDRMPTHHRAGYQVLRPFEAITLAESRVA